MSDVIAEGSVDYPWDDAWDPSKAGDKGSPDVSWLDKLDLDPPPPFLG